MKDKKEKIEKTSADAPLHEEQNRSQNEPNDANDANETNEAPAEPTAEELLAQAQERIAELEDKNLRMMAEFDNYRRRTNKEKLDIMANAGERIFTEMLPLVDDFERGIANLTPTLSQGEGGEAQYEAVVNGMKLIYQKFLSFLDKNDVHPIETDDADFNTDEHEAVTTFAAGDDKKGKVIDCTQKGYKLGEKVIRFAKVVVGE